MAPPKDKKIGDEGPDMASSELLASYEEISREIGRRGVGREPEPV
ncbi:hypothetical protein [Arthrobacter sp. UYCu723]